MDTATVLKLQPGGNFTLYMEAQYPSCVKYVFTDADDDIARVSIYATHVYVDTNPSSTDNTIGVNFPLPVMRFFLLVQESLISA